MIVQCSVGRELVQRTDAEVLRETVTGSGPGTPVYACHTCIRDNGLIPERPATFIGHRDMAPTPAGAV